MPLLKLLISRGANIWRGNVSGQSPLISAVIVSNCWERTCFPDLLELLSPLIEVRDHAGRTVLHHIAVSSGIKGRAPSSKYYLEALLEFLVRIGTAPGAPGTAPTASMISQKSTTDPQLTNGDSSSQDSILSNAKGAVNLVRFLSHIVNARDKAGNTALNLVARIGNRSIIQQLLEIHADPGLANNKGVSAKDFGVGADGGLSNGLASQQSTQAMPDTQEEDAGEGAAQVSQTEDLSQDVITSMTTLLTSNMTTHRDLLTQRTEAIDRLNAQIREFSAIQTTELERLRETQTRVKARGERQARLANLSRFKNTKAQTPHPTTALGEADTAILPAELMTVLLNADAAFSPQLAAGLPSTAFLRQNIEAYHNNNALLQRQDAGLRSRSLELEGLYRKVVSLCTDVEEGRVEEALPSLVQAVESERGGMRGEGEVGRVREFLRRVDGRSEG
ncbi:transcriptional regulator swi6 [Oleoguttula sp. CCFEE 5521]